MGMRIPAPRTIEHGPLEAVEREIGGPQRVLPGKDQARRQAASAQGDRDRRKLDGFWTGSDDDVDTLD